MGNGLKESSSAKNNGSGAELNMDAVAALAADMKGKNAVTLMFCTQHPATLIFDAQAMALARIQDCRW